MAGSWHSLEAFTVEGAFDTNDTTQRNPLGLIVRAVDTGSDARGAGEFIYLKGVASTAIGTWVHYTSDDYATVRAVADGIGPLAVALAATVANQFGWYQIQGKASALALTGFADNAKCFLTATNGSIDDADVAGDHIWGARGAGAVDETSLLADVEMWRPATHDGDDN